jgi:ABC-type polar amino acid transport system ATPase subunit
VILVHGAFGCGKSYLLVAIIRFISTLLDQIGNTDIKILVCALTNIAVDRILMMLKNSHFEDFARVGSLKKINKSLLRYTHHSSSNKKQADKDALRDLETMKEELRASTRGSKMTGSQYEELMALEASI